MEEVLCVRTFVTGLLCVEVFLVGVVCRLLTEVLEEARLGAPVEEASLLPTLVEAMVEVETVEEEGVVMERLEEVAGKFSISEGELTTILVALLALLLETMSFIMAKASIILLGRPCSACSAE